MWPPPCTSHSPVCISLYITVNYSNSPDYSTPFPTSIFPVPCPLWALCHHSSYNMLSVSLKKLPKTIHVLLNQPWETFWQSREGKQGVERENEWRSWENYFIASGEVILHMPPFFSSCSYLQNELNKNSPTHLLWLCTQVQSVYWLPPGSAGTSKAVPFSKPNFSTQTMQTK